MMSGEFKSKLEEIMPAEELLFESTPAFGHYKKFLGHAVAHPAKMNTKLLEFLIKNFTKEGDVILDPMAGTGSTGVVAALHGRNAVCVELEEKFYKWMEKAREYVENHPTLTPKGWIKNICGDARKLSELLQKEADVIVTSPPYSDVAKRDRSKEDWWDEDRERKMAGGSITIAKGYQGSPNNIGNLPHGNIDAVITSPPYLNVDNVKEKSEEFWKKAKELGIRWGSKPPAGTEQKLMTSKENIGNLPLGSIDVIITSPPYAESLSRAAQYNPDKASTERINQEKGGTIPRPYSDNPNNIGNLLLGNIDAIITSPPYAHEATASKPTKLEKEGKFRMGHSKEESYTDEDYRSWSKRKGGNIGKCKLFVRVPCSPEEAQFHDTRPERKGTIWEYTKEVEATFDVIEKIQKLKDEKRGKSETYLEAMLKVYGEMYKVLKPNGLAIIVVKPFVRNKKVVDLPYHTWLLLQKVGFKLVKLYKLRLKQRSFWRILYERKFPEVPKIRHEYVIVVKK